MALKAYTRSITTTSVYVVRTFMQTGSERRRTVNLSTAKTAVQQHAVEARARWMDDHFIQVSTNFNGVCYTRLEEVETSTSVESALASFQRENGSAVERATTAIAAAIATATATAGSGLQRAMAARRGSTGALLSAEQ
eukprot:18197-Heterococcus_DN1.PRE.1